MKYLYAILIASLLVACTEQKEEKSEFEVEFYGALKDMMHKGDLSAKADLNDFKDKDHLFALGAMENLKGEIQIFDGKSMNTFIQDSSVQFDNSFEKKAALLVCSQVESWKSFAIPKGIESMEDLQSFVSMKAGENGIDIHKPFPFLVEGTVSSCDWHVINWPEGDTEHSHEKHVSSGLNGSFEKEEVELVGFYSDSHHRIFTHHSTNMHIHFRKLDDSLAGHADDLVLGEGMTLKLPDNQ